MRPIAALIALTLLITACGGDDDTSPTSSTSPTTTTRTQTPETTTSNNTGPSPTPTPCAVFPLDIYRLVVATGFTTTVAKGIDGTWSPNSGYFAYVVPPGSQACGEGLNIDAAVSHQRQFVVPGGIGAWAWSPDSTSVAVSSYDGETIRESDSFNVFSVPSGEATLLVESSVSALAWAPDGHAIAFLKPGETDTHLYTIDIDGDQVDYGAIVPSGAIQDVAWSPLLDRIAVTAQEAGDIEPARIYSVSWPDGTVTEVASSPGSITEPRFSPNGSHILYKSLEGSTLNVYVVPFDGSAPPILLAEDANMATFSPDGNLIAYVAGWCQSFDIAIIAPDGTGQTIVSPATEAGVQLEPTWSPDGNLIAFYSDVTYTVHPDGTNLTRVADRMENLAFSPDGSFLTGQAIGGRGLCEG